MSDYHDHYLRKDVLLIDNAFEKFIGTCLKFYRLDPCHYFSSPGLSWDAMLKMTGVELKKNSDIRICLFIEKGLSGGISYISIDTVKQITNIWKTMILQNRQNTYRTLIWIIYMVGQWVVILPMAVKWFKNVDNFDVSSISENSPIGYILEDHLEYTKKLHVLYIDYPLPPEKLAIPYDMLSDYSKKIADQYGIKVADVMRLIPNLGNKTNYVLRYKNLQLCFSLGMKLN